MICYINDNVSNREYNELRTENHDQENDKHVMIYLNNNKNDVISSTSDNISNNDNDIIDVTNNREQN